MSEIIRGMVIGAATLVFACLAAALLVGADEPNSWLKPRSFLFLLARQWAPYAAVVGGAVAAVGGSRWTAVVMGLSIAFLCSAVMALLCVLVNRHGLMEWCAYTICYLYWQAPVAVVVSLVVHWTMHER